MINLAGNDFLINGLIKKYDKLKKSFDNNDFENIINNFKDYLSEVFPFREKNNIQNEINSNIKLCNTYLTNYEVFPIIQELHQDTLNIKNI